MGYRVAPRPFIVEFRLYSAGRFHFDDSTEHDWFVRGSTTDDDPSVAPGIILNLGAYDTIQAAYTALNYKMGTNY